MLDKVSIGIISYNEEKYIGLLLEQILNQDYDLSKIELLFADGLSTDNTLKIIENFKNENIQKFKDIKILTNLKRVQPSGWKIIVDNFSGEMLIRLDAHSRISIDFVKNNVKCIQSGEFVCGGPRENILDDDANEILLIAEKSMFGSGIAKYRNGIEKKEYVKTVAHACYRKEVFEKAGNFNELLIRSEDNEMHYRIRKNNYKICMDPSITSQYITRPSLGKMLKQKYANGEWIGITSLSKTHKIFSVYHYIPMLFVLSLFFTILLGVIGSSFKNNYFWIPFIILLSLYFFIMFLLSIFICKRKIKYIFILPILLFLLHFFYGLGTVLSIFKFGTILNIKKEKIRYKKNIYNSANL